MSAIDNTRTAWKEVTPNCLKGAWKKLWPETCSNLGEVEEETVIQDTAELVNEEGLEGVNVDSVEELLQSGGERLTND
jgi:hypothetical protein